MACAVRLRGGGRFTVDRYVSAGAIDHFEAATTPLPDADLRLGISRRDDPRDLPGDRVTNEIEAKARAMSQVGAVDDVDHRDDVPARSFPDEGNERREQPASQNHAKDDEEWLDQPVALEE